jgi:HSP20 family protein
MRDLLTMQERLESLFGRAAPGWVPAVDLVERPDTYVLTVELPGMKRDDVRIECQGDIVVSAASGRARRAAPSAISSSSVGRATSRDPFRFAHPIEGDGINAELVLGVLTVTIPKTSGVRIDVA